MNESAVEILKEQLVHKREEVRKLEEAIKLLTGVSKVYVNGKATRPKKRIIKKYEGKQAHEVLLEIIKSNMPEEGAKFADISRWGAKFAKMPRGTVSSSLFQLKTSKFVKQADDGTYKLVG